MSSGCAAQNGSAESWMTLELEKTTLQTRGEKLFEQMRWESFNFAHILGLRCLRASNVPTMRTINNVPTKTLYHKDHQ